jgi:hypothetical protein
MFVFTVSLLSASFQISFGNLEQLRSQTANITVDNAGIHKTSKSVKFKIVSKSLSIKTVLSK